MNDEIKVYVKLINEAVDVWRPVNALLLHGDVYSITTQPYDPETETWQFTPGDEVICEWRELSEGKSLVAVASAK